MTNDMTLTKSLDDSTEVDLSVFETREIRTILKSKAHCLRAGFPLDHMIISVFDEIRGDYVKRVGLATYLSQMLGNLANLPVQNCKFFDESGRPMAIHLSGDEQQPVQRFVARQFGRKNLPFRVDIRKDPNSSQIETRYL